MVSDGDWFLFLIIAEGSVVVGSTRFCLLREEFLALLAWRRSSTIGLAAGAVKFYGSIEVPQVQYIDRIVDVTVCVATTVRPIRTVQKAGGRSSDSVSYSGGKCTCGDTATRTNVPEGAKKPMSSSRGPYNIVLHTRSIGLSQLFEARVYSFHVF